ncbi:MAG: DUF3179 domain-containing protein, partial [Bacteroidetes bacterium]|nr:DUF3179 domain-containing protein [Bacteroidota bacterium]
MPSELTNKTSAPRNDSFLSRNSNKLLIAGLVFFFIPTALRTYFVMPFPGSQDLEVISLAYYLEKTLIYSRLIGMALLAGPITIGILHPRLIKKILFTFLIIAMGSFYYVFDFEFTAEKFFPEPENLAFEQSDANQVPLENLIIGVKYGGEAKAYPLNYLAYHHKIQDTVGGLPVLITYCIMCRSGRVFSPILDDEHHTFRVVGANHYNAIFEDQKTGSWWYQATGEAVVGKLKGALLEELDYEQLTLAAWVEQQPETYIMQPDSIYSEAYEARKEF